MKMANSGLLVIKSQEDMKSTSQDSSTAGKSAKFINPTVRSSREIRDQQVITLAAWMTLT